MLLFFCESIHLMYEIVFNGVKFNGANAGICDDYDACGDCDDCDWIYVSLQQMVVF